MMDFFSDIDSSKHMYSSFVVGYPKVRFRRTIPHTDINVIYM